MSSINPVDVTVNTSPQVETLVLPGVIVIYKGCLIRSKKDPLIKGIIFELYDPGKTPKPISIYLSETGAQKLSLDEYVASYEVYGVAI